MGDILSKLDSEGILAVFGMGVGVVAILCAGAVLMATVIVWQRRRTQLDEMEATLKMEMIQRGMTADDIKKVLGAEMGASKASSLNEGRARWAGFHKACGTAGGAAKG